MVRMRIWVRHESGTAIVIVDHPSMMESDCALREFLRSGVQSDAQFYPAHSIINIHREVL